MLLAFDGNGGFAIEGVERCCINGGVRDGDGVSVAGFAEASECGHVAIREGGGDDSGCGNSECVGLVGGGSAAADVDGFITETGNAVGGVSVDQVISSTIRVLMELASMAPEVWPSRVLRTETSSVVSERVTSSSSRPEMEPLIGVGGDEDHQQHR